MKEKNSELYEKIKNVLIKKAEGFYFNEEILEYQTEDNKTTINQTENTPIKTNKNDKTKPKQKETNLTLLKKKVTTHYVPPDLLAIKMLVEIYGEKIDDKNELLNLDYNQLLELKNSLINQLKNEQGE